MPVYAVYAIATASKFVGHFEADSPEEAEAMVEGSPTADDSMRLCHQCAGEIEIGDVYEYQFDEV